MKFLLLTLLAVFQLSTTEKIKAEVTLKKEFGYSKAEETIMIRRRSVSCAFNGDTAQEGEFSTGYIATFETLPNGTSIEITFQLLDTDRAGVVGFLWQQTPFTEFNMTDLGDNTFGITMDNLTNGETVTYACKFAFAGGLAVTEYIDYVVGEVCEPDPMEDATLSDIQIDGVSIPEFSASQLSYTYETTATTPPAVTAITTQPTASVEITPATSVPGTTTIVVTAENGTTTQTYSVQFERQINYVLVWSDEFEDDGAVNAENWHHQTIPIINGTDWANDEVQHYTDRIDNSIVENGTLKIIAKAETGYQQNGVSKDYTSARLNSKFAFTYGRVDIRAKLPEQLGTWPALWTLGQNISETGAYWQEQGFGNTPWPVTGEIDIMEQFGRSSIEKNEIHGSIHTPVSWGATENTRKTTLNTSTSGFHVYSVIWDENEIKFLVDDMEYYTYNPTEKYGGKVTDPNRGDMNWPFDEPQYLILNVAMGGVLGGNIPSDFAEGSMEIDYVRVFQEGETLTLEDATFSIDEDSQNGTIVGTVPTNYLDDGTLMYAIISGNEGETFQIEPTTGEISVANSEGLDFSTTPNYSLTIEATDGEVRDTAIIHVNINQVSIPLSVDDALYEKLSVYPNPVNSTLKLKIEQPTALEPLYVTDLSGKKLSVSIIKNTDSYQLDFSKEAPGVYLLILKIENKRYSIRVQKN